MFTMPKNVKGGAENAATLTFPGTLKINAPGFLLSGTLQVPAAIDECPSGGLRLTAALMEMIGYCIIDLLGKLHEQMNGFFYVRNYLLKRKCSMKGKLFSGALQLQQCSCAGRQRQAAGHFPEGGKAMKNTSIKKICTLCCLITMIALFIPCAGMGEASAFAYPYGVFLGITDNLAQFGDYEIVVIDAQYFSGEEIERFRNEGHQVYTYLNIGSLEDFRDYYEDYKDLSLGEYEHWEEEVWVDVSSRKWQDLILQELVPGLLEKQVDGFFVDNCDVYYEYPEQKILDGLGVIMQELVATGKEVIINSGDCFMDAWCEQGGMWDQVITGINQESVFSSILWDENAFGRQEEEDHEYFVSYITRYGEMGARIFLLEYTLDEELVREIDQYCREHGFIYFVSHTLELVG